MKSFLLAPLLPSLLAAGLHNLPDLKRSPASIYLLLATDDSHQEKAVTKIVFVSNGN